MKYSLSIVSHRSGAHIRELLRDLTERLPVDSEIIITFNVVEDESFLNDFGKLPIRVLRNVRPLGFGANHNQAFAVSAGEYFIVVNPDIRLPTSPFDALQRALATPRTGAVAPLVLASDGKIDDSARRFPTVARLAARLLTRKRVSDYQPGRDGLPVRVDWCAGMFVMFARSAFNAVQGFDTRYFMYMEDADICRRLGASQWQVLLAPQARVIHDAQRASHRNPQHLRWHLRSAVRFLFKV